MDKHSAELLCTKGLCFFGTIVAGQSHEATNVLNIINELVGLQSDLLCGADLGQSIDVGKLKQVADRIRSQVMRGEMIIRSVNRFAHSVDCPVTVFDLKEALEQIVYLAQRATRLGQTRLDQDFPKESMPLETSPFGFKQAVFRCIEIALAASSQKRLITVTYEVLERGTEIIIESADPIPPGPLEAERRAFLGLLMQELGGEFVDPSQERDAHRLALFLPRPSAIDRASDDH